QRSRQRQQGDQKPKPPPQRSALAVHQLIAAETAVAVEWPRHAAASRALVQLHAAVSAADLFTGVVHQHGRLVAARAQARRDKRQRRELQISVITGITIGRRCVSWYTVFDTASWTVPWSSPSSGCEFVNCLMLSSTDSRASAMSLVDSS